MDDQQLTGNRTAIAIAKLTRTLTGHQALVLVDCPSQHHIVQAQSNDHQWTSWLVNRFGTQAAPLAQRSAVSDDR